MDRLVQLEAKKIMKELDFLRSDLEYKNEIVSEADSSFMRGVGDFLDDNRDLKEIFDKKLDERLNRTISDRSEVVVDAGDGGSGVENSTVQNPKLKKLYREIAKKTHPDKISDDRMNGIYMDATRSYGDGDLFEIYSICESLGISFDVDESDISLMREEINNVRNRIQFLESTGAWAWYNSDDESMKKDMILKYISHQIR